MKYPTLVASCVVLSLLILGCEQEPLSPGDSPASNQALGNAALRTGFGPGGPHYLPSRNPQTGEPIFIPAKPVRGRLTLDADGVGIVYEGESVDDPAPPNVTFDGDGSTFEFTDFRPVAKAVDDDGATEIVLPASCKIWVSGALPLLEEIRATNRVCTGTYQCYSSVPGDSPARGGEELVKTWSVSFDNGRINRVELVSDSDPNTFDYIELEIVADHWEFNQDTERYR